MDTFAGHLAGYADRFLISFYRLTGLSWVDYFVGTLSLAFICVLIGELSLSVGFRFNKRYTDEMAKESKTKESLSLQAYHSGDKISYRALNKEATEAWGRHFFTTIAYSAGILWPVPFALGWMQTRFHGVEFPLAFPLTAVFGQKVGYTFTFIPIYILCRIIFKYLRPFLPYFKNIQRRLDQ